MGVVNPRAICPHCGGKIHTQMGETGKHCQWCGEALTGRVGLDNKADATINFQQVFVGGAMIFAAVVTAVRGTVDIGMSIGFVVIGTGFVIAGLKRSEVQTKDP
jgi:uncharacterized protein (DUF983 family)